MSVFVTGASGFIGSALTPALWAAGHTIYRCNLECFPPPPRPLGIVVHLAADTSPVGHWWANVFGSAYVAAWLEPEARLVFASTLTAATPHDQYDREKALGEQIVRARRDIMAVILRLGNVYGPGPQSQRCVLNALMRQAAAGEALRVYGNAHGCRDYVHVDDVVRAFLLALEAPPGTYDVGMAVPHTLAEAAAIVARATGVSVEVAPDAVGQHHATAQESRWLPGWQPAISLTDGITTTLDWLARQEVQEVPV